MDERIQRLKLAAEEGPIDTLYTLIQEEVKLLEDIDALPFVETPLHTAVSAGKIPFAMEMMRLKPSFIRKLNPNGLSPIHLALPYEQTHMVHIRMVRRLLQVDGDLVRVKGKEGKTILHHAAARDDHPELLTELLLACPQSIEDVTIHNETALHIALKENKLQAFQDLVGWLRKSWIKNSKFRERTILNWKDEDDNTVLHVAVSKNQPKAVKLLLSCGVDIKDQNLLGRTVMDILRGQPQVANTEIKAQSLIEDMLWCAGASCTPSPRTATSCGAPFLSTVASCGAPFLSTGSCASCADCLRSAISPIEKLIIFHRRQHTKITDDMRNALLVVAVLIVTVTYQAALSPPGGLWQDNSNPITNVNQYNTSYSPHKAGTLVMGPLNAAIFVLANSVTFYLSISIIFFLIPIDSTSGIVSITLFYLNICYLASMAAISTSPMTWLLAILPITMVAQLLIFYDCLGACQAAVEMCRGCLGTCRFFYKKVCDFFNGR